ncbi:helix-turn-helix domain-containing protein [Saccharopolyspora sp. ASAGF58]|uniref:helix-turn-helix domain-containing protein n=1 Tax=Saccharopolyspora sp. ASAGF58 TaxID=2719023 RepID=UPI00143FF039|nr:helix-turn-helix domain-containing protein [Saccharopolyspora sp. ASAGF58]QIZ37872.1 helix-turn-helix domain-containing protein [Saccharopolyspora sp. ASAGF58]
MSNVGRPAYFTVRKAAWLLSVDPSMISRAIRLGTLRTVQRNGRSLIPASELVRLLGEPTDNGATQAGGRQ